MLPDARSSFRHEALVHEGLDGMDAAAPFARSLPVPPTSAQVHEFEPDSMSLLRTMVAVEARSAGLRDDLTSDLVLAVSELAANSMLYGGGHGELITWREGSKVVCEVRDSGPNALGGRGLWLVNQLCDLVQLRCFPTGTVVRVHMHCR